MTKVLLIASLLILPAFACCTAWRLGGDRIQIADQEVFIVWDAARKTEHFIRRANFGSEAVPEDFGFLVPTPTKPALSEIPDTVFRDLGEIIKPKVEVRKSTKLSLMPLLLQPFFLTATKFAQKDSAVMASSVEVLENAIVGGFEVAVLRASVTGDLLEWLEKNGYDARPELRDWIKPYVEKKWIVTAFKYASGSDLSGASLTRSSVCLSFETDVPFFPYRVPEDVRVEPEEGSLLRIYFAGTERVLGEFESGGDRSWSAATKFSDRDEELAGIVGRLPGVSGDFEQGMWLTAFEDETWPGGARDLYFKPSPESDAITPPPIKRSEVTTIHAPLDLILLVAGLGVYFYRKVVKSREREFSR